MDLREIATKVATQLREDGRDALAVELRDALVAFERKPLDLLLFCPRCSQQHVDAPDPAKGWLNPPHATHTCAHCGLLWRPSNALTNGVRSLPALEDKHVERILAAQPSIHGGGVQADAYELAAEVAEHHGAENAAAAIRALKKAAPQDRMGESPRDASGNSPASSASSGDLPAAVRSA